MTGDVLLLVVAAAAYGAGGALWIRGATRGRRAMRGARWAVVAGFVAHTTAVAVRTAELRHAPVSTPLDSATLFLWVVAGVFLALETWRAPASLGAFVAPGLAGLLAGALLFCGRQPAPRAALSRAWLGAHLVPMTLAYAALALGLVCAAMYLVQDRRLKRRRPEGGGILQGLPALETLDRLMRGAVAAAFPLLTVGVLVGVVWMLVEPGALATAWYRNAKVVGALVLWSGCAAVVHLRARALVRGRRAAWAVLLVFVLALATFFGGHGVRAAGPAPPGRHEVGNG